MNFHILYIWEVIKIEKLVLEEKRGRKFTKEEYEISWNQIVKVGDDIILIDTRNK